MFLGHMLLRYIRAEQQTAVQLFILHPLTKRLYKSKGCVTWRIHLSAKTLAKADKANYRDIRVEITALVSLTHSQLNLKLGIKKHFSSLK